MVFVLGYCLGCCFLCSSSNLPRNLLKRWKNRQPKTDIEHITSHSKSYQSYESSMELFTKHHLWNLLGKQFQIMCDDSDDSDDMM